jgi:hypothetical protein
MMLRSAFFLLLAAGSSFVVWLGLFIVTRELPAQWNLKSILRRPAVLAGAALLLLAVFLFGVTMQTLAATPAEFIRWQRATWWTVPLAEWLFLWALIREVYYPYGTPQQWRWIRWGVFGLLGYALLVALGAMLGVFVDNAAIVRLEHAVAPFRVPSRLPQYYVYGLYVLGLLVANVGITLHAGWRARHQGIGEVGRVYWLGVGAALAVIGAVIGVVIQPLTAGRVPTQLGMVIVVLGLGVVGYGIVRNNTLLHENVLQQDFWHSLFTTALTALGFVLCAVALFLLIGYPYPPVLTPLLMLLAALSQTPLRWYEWPLLWPYLPRWLQRLQDPPHSPLPNPTNTLQTPTAPQGSSGPAGRGLAEVPLTPAPPHGSTELAEVPFPSSPPAPHPAPPDLAPFCTQAVDQIFQYTYFQSDDVLAASRLHELQLVQRYCAQVARTLGVPTDALTVGQRATALRTALTALITREVTPAVLPGGSLPAPLEFFLLQKKYVEALPRTAVEQLIYEQYGLVVTGGAYSRLLYVARHRLAEAIVQAERQMVG